MRRKGKKWNFSTDLYSVWYQFPTMRAYNLFTRISEGDGPSHFYFHDQIYILRSKFRPDLEENLLFRIHD